MSSRVASSRRAPARRDVPQCSPTPRASARALVARAPLVRRLINARELPLVVLAAPAGYGKTTTLQEWAQHDARRFAWVALERADNDPEHLLASVEVSTAALRRGGGASVLVLDDVDVLRSPAAIEALTTLVEHPPPGAQVVVASRGALQLRLGRLRAHRGVLELTARDLVMTRGEAAELLELAGVHLEAAQVDALVSRTEGWPAGLYLAALSLREQPDPATAVSRFGGDDRVVSDYVADTLLADLSDDEIGFLLRTSVLDTLSGPLCDAVLRQPGAAARLRRLARASGLLIALDRTDHWYRYHGLLAEALRAELRGREPGIEPELHRRATRWHADHGDIESAIRHAAAAGDVELAGDLLWANALHYLAEGHEVSIRRWLGHFTDEQTASCPPLALATAIADLARGERDLAEHWTGEAVRALSGEASARATPALEAGVAVMHAAIARHGVERMRDDAARAHALEPGDSPWRALECQLEGTARHLLGERERARALLRDGCRRGLTAAPSVNALCLAQLALIARESGDRYDATELALRARAQLERFGLSDEPTMSLVLAVCALTKAQRSQFDAARRDAVAAARLLERFVDVAPWYEAEVSIVLARVMVTLGDVVGARALLDDADCALRGAPDATVLITWLTDARQAVGTYVGSAAGSPAALTAAELRVLRLLPTHLSFREIGSRLYISPNTVKSQAQAVYRKLDASTRSQAVARAHELGLLDGAVAA
jgi:LuxR family transcriptional regulator, maltose regulon positive regulatory protein